MKKYWIGILSFLVLVGLDQYTKYLVLHHLKNTEGINVVPGVFRLEYLENRGAAFGIFQGQQIFLLLITLIILALLGLFFYRIPMQHKYIPMQLVLVLIASGAVGNMIDRICRKYVIDFLYFKLIDFPIFNVADCYVVIGAVLAIIFILFYYEEEDYTFLH